jgi:hypothetical protein
MACSGTLSYGNTNTMDRVLPEKLICPKLLKKVLAFYTTQRFFTIFTTACHLSLS